MKRALLCQLQVLFIQVLQLLYVLIKYFLGSSYTIEFNTETV